MNLNPIAGESRLEHSLVCGSLVAVAAFGLSLEAASVIQFSDALYRVTEGTDHVDILIQRTNDLGSVVSVEFTTTTNGTATPGADYIAVSTNLTFQANQTDGIVSVPVLNDALAEGLEAVQVTLSNPTGGAVLGERASASVRITDNDKRLGFEYNDYSVVEDAGPVWVAVLRQDDGPFPVTVDYATSDRTAIAGQDYVQTSGTLRFEAGGTVKLIPIPILNDGAKERDETLHLVLSNPTGNISFGGASPITVTVTIVDNDPGVQLERNKLWVHDTDGVLDVTVLRGSDGTLDPFTVDYTTTDFTATAGSDYEAISGRLEFARGEMVKTLKIPIFYDEVDEPDETFRLTLSGLTGPLGFGPNTILTVTILDTIGTRPHEFSGVRVRPDQRVELTLDGSVHKRFGDYYDLYPVEVSTNLVDWSPLITLTRTNASTNTLTYVDARTPLDTHRYYRTVTNHLLTPYGPPSGPFAVGILSRLVTNPNRRNRYDVSTNMSFMISIWYPAQAQAGKLPAFIQDLPLARDATFISLVGGSIGAYLSRAADLHGHALPDVPWAPTEGRCPIVVNSPGYFASRYDMSEKGPLLASHGYVVVSIDHADVTGTVFPDGTFLHGSTAIDSSATRFQERVDDVRTVLDELERWNDTDPVLRGRLDPTRVAVTGMSWGGGVACQVARVDSRCRAAIVLDGYFQTATEVVSLGLQKPSLSLYSDPFSDPGGELLLYSNPATRSAIWLQVRSTIHGQFMDLYWENGDSALSGGREVERIFAGYGLWFLNKHLKGMDAPMPKPSDYPRIMNFKQK